MGKTLENDMHTGVMLGFLGLIVNIPHDPKYFVP